MALRCVLAFASLCLAIAAGHTSNLHKYATSSGPLPPSEDSWYTAPAGYEKTEPGTVLRLRPALGNLTQITGNTSASYNILYRTTDSQYRPAWAVTTLFIPELGPNSTAQLMFNQSVLVSYQVPYDSADINASPSYSLYSTQAPHPIGASLGLGLFVSIPDFEGQLASFTAGVFSGHATIDSIRAVLSLGLGLNTTSPRVALWGYSGGALASGVQYAPELSETIVGAALGGLTPNITSVLESISGADWAGLAPGSILGLSSQYPEVQEYLISQLKTSGPHNKTGFLAAEDMDVNETFLTYAGDNITDYFKNGMATFLDPKVQTIINRDGIMGYHGVPQVPIFAYKAIHDEISKVADTDILVERYCQVGANILYQRNSIGTHTEDFLYSLPAAAEWLAAVLTGSQGCTTQNVTRNSTTLGNAKRSDMV
ncbi:secretory lipase-domain-containing protein [Thelonectria olida]|uniref:Secretory lipase-domain-containing protein n=1 Tax=Thelonectria olida TaxID=1576542 RepID=A0A9P9AIN0_9HYPO|nr:secretory lipase-domain-containing protein [Thelonectria olida]